MLFLASRQDGELFGVKVIAAVACTSSVVLFRSNAAKCFFDRQCTACCNQLPSAKCCGAQHRYVGQYPAGSARRCCADPCCDRERRAEASLGSTVGARLFHSSRHKPPQAAIRFALRTRSLTRCGLVCMFDLDNSHSVAARAVQLTAGLQQWSAVSTAVGPQE